MLHILKSPLKFIAREYNELVTLCLQYCVHKYMTWTDLQGRCDVSAFYLLIRKLADRFCKPIDIKLVFTTFKIKNLYNLKVASPEGVRTRVVYKFSCTSCNACYVGKPANISPHACVSTYYRTDLLTSLGICRV